MTTAASAQPLPRREARTLSGEPTPLLTLGRELWAARSLILILARKDFFVRYRRATFGLLWAVGLPLLQAGVLALIFSHVVRFQATHSYVVFVLSGTVLWTFFSGALSPAATAIVDGSGLSTQIYFPRAVLPLVSVIANLYGLALSVAVFLVTALAFGVPVRPRLLLLVAAIALVTALVSALGILLSGVHVYFRDVRYVVQASLMVWFYVTPIIYPLKLSQLKHIAPWLRANPMTGPVELFRAATGNADPHWMIAVWWSVGWTVVLLAIAAVVHRRFNRVFVDLL